MAGAALPTGEAEVPAVIDQAFVAAFRVVMFCGAALGSAACRARFAPTRGA
jgi:hypothetical protein